MKKILLLIILISASLTSFSQSISYGIRGGVNFAELQASSVEFGGSQNTGNLTTFSAGVFADFKFGHVSIQPGLFINGKGGKENAYLNDGDMTVSENEKISLIYVQLPVDLVYHIPVVVGNIYFGAGPYFAAGLSGRLKANISVTSVSDPSQNQNTTIDQSAKFGNNADSDFKTSEVGANIMGGVKFKSGFIIHVNYDFGLTNILSDAATAEGAAKLKNRIFGVSVGYAF
ncbi:MAG TPA: porin family protein [Mucilaginibacter sp.]|nr:porin family protein [Mucilaginibacter sp.]